ncbi:PTS lactose/cellobiose transporter subunit IIA [Fusobacterium sp.]|uniref:PTS lactose/cellobiose transporter subunit IIA n=1 Tax=Fusobacterium sp. TaxID=68766 RepID=UPI0026368DD7|nr:PTS lactose/cellobiose transporter subunit IIA [Fusobacterium sp.]
MTDFNNLTEEKLEELEEIVFGIISYAGEAKSLAYEALRLSEIGNFEKVDALLEASQKAVMEAHHIQTDLIQKEAAGEKTPISMLFVHAQDHLMGALSEKELITKMVAQNKRLFEIEKVLFNK